MANRELATAKARSGSRAASRFFFIGARIFATGVGLVSLVSGGYCLAANKVRITGLTDVSFGTVANLNIDAIRSENVCVFSNSATNGYNVTALGSGSGNAFTLSSGVGTLAYEAQWSSASGQTSGFQLFPNVPLSGQVSSATQQSCNSGPATSASLIIVLRSPALSAATAGSYSGTLTLVIGPE